MEKALILLCIGIFMMSSCSLENVVATIELPEISSDSEIINVTIEKDGIEYIYRDNVLISIAPIMNETELKEYEKNIIEEYNYSIMSEIGNNETLKKYYQDLLNTNIGYQDIPELIKEKRINYYKQLPDLNNITLDNIRNNKVVKDDEKIDPDTYGFSPTTRGAHWNEVMRDGFEDYDLTDWEEYEVGGGDASIVSGTSGNCGSGVDGTKRMRINSDGVSEKTIVKSFPLDIYTGSSGETSYNNMYYKISIRFCLDDTSSGHNANVYLILNHQINVIITDNNKIKYVETGGTSTFYSGLSEDTWYTLEAYYSIDDDEYTLRLLDSSGNHLWYENAIDNFWDNAINYLKIGDDSTGSGNYADLSLDKIKVWGHSKAKFYENFDYGFWYDWRVQANEGQSIKQDSNKDLEIDSNNKALANSQTIDYDSTEDYSIAIYFKMVDSDQRVMRLIDNGEICINLYSNNWIKYYTSSPQGITTLITDDWYYVLVDIYPNANPNPYYDIWINNPQKVGNPNVQGETNFCTNVRDDIRIGGGTDEYGNILVKYFKLLGDIGTDSEGSPDGLSDNFEDNPNIQIFGDDMENLWIGKNHWTWGGDNIWEQDNPSNGPSKGAASSDQCFGTVSDSNYPNDAEAYLRTPWIDISNVPDDTNLKLQFDHWYLTEDGYDGGQVNLHRSSDKSAYTITKIVPDGEYDGYVNALSGVGFTSNSNGWIYFEKFTIDSDTWYDASKDYLRIEFEFQSDYSLRYAGWYIDNIKIHAASDSSNDDSDGDNSLSDGEEYYIWGSSPLLLDTDEDGLTDRQEAELDMLNNPYLDEGRSNPSDEDIFIEIDYQDKNGEEDTVHKWPGSDIDAIQLVFDNYGITMHIVWDQKLSYSNAGGGTTTDAEFGYDNIDSDTIYGNYFTDSRQLIYHYILAGVNDVQDAQGSSDCNGDASILDYHAPGENNRDELFMHEFGHQLGLHHSTSLSTAMYGGASYTGNNAYLNSEWQDLYFVIEDVGGTHCIHHNS